MPSLRAAFTAFLLVAAAAVVGLLMGDRLACLFQTPYKSAVSGVDNSFYYYWLRAALAPGHPSFLVSLHETDTMGDQEEAFFIQDGESRGGVVPNKYGIGWAVSSAPFYLLADGAVLAANGLFGARIPRDGYGAPYQLAIFLGQLALALLGLFLAWRIVRRWVAEPYALWGVALGWLGSFMVYYQATNLSMVHNAVFVAVVACYWCALRVKEGGNGWNWLGMGLAGGLAVIGRYQAAVYLFFPAWVLVSRLRAGPRSAVPGAALALAGGGAMVFLQLLGWKLVYGTWFYHPYENEPFYWGHPVLWKELFSPLHGLFYWSPALLVGAAGFVGWIVRERREPGPFWLASLLATWYINAAWWCWWFSASFGARAFDASLLFFLLGTAWAIEKAPPRFFLRPALIAVLTLLAAANVVLAYEGRKDRLPLYLPITHGEMWRTIEASPLLFSSPKPNP